MERIKVFLSTSYSGGVKCNVYIDGVKHILENAELVRVLEKLMTERGYSKEIAPRQQYERIIIND